MTTNQDLLDEIQTTLGEALIPSLTTSSAADDLYEAYIFSLVIEAARAEGAAHIEFKSRNNASPTSFVFRTSPGYLNSSAKDYGYAEIEFTGKPILEAHLGVRIEGHSEVLHECDICVLLKSEAELCRLSPMRIAPRSKTVIIAVEAKYYTTDLSLNLGRAFLGLVSDSSAEKSYFVVNRNSDSIEKLLTHKKKYWEHKIIPQNRNEVNRLRSMFQVAFRDFKAKHRL